MANKIQVKRGVLANLPTLSVGEPAFTTDTNEFFIGNGTANVKLAKASDLSETVKQSKVNINYYVDVTNGNDNNDGLTIGNAFKTIQYAIDKLPQTLNHTATINVADGTYNEELTVNFIGNLGVLYIIGNIETPSNCIIKSFFIASSSYIIIKGFKDSVVGGNLKTFSVVNSMNVMINNCLLNTSDVGGYGVIVDSSNVTVSNCNISNKFSAILGYANAKIYSINNVGSGNNVGIMSNSNSSIAKNGTQPSGTTSEVSANGGVIR